MSWALYIEMYLKKPNFHFQRFARSEVWKSEKNSCIRLILQDIYRLKANRPPTSCLPSLQKRERERLCWLVDSTGQSNTMAASGARSAGMKQRLRIHCTENPKSHTVYPDNLSSTPAASPTSLSNSLTSEYCACRHDT